MLNLKSFFAFTKRTNNVGVGTSDLAFLRSQTLPVNSNYLGPQWNVKRQMLPCGAPGFMKYNQTVVPVGIRGAGLGIGGQYTMIPLVSMGEE